MFLDGIDNFEMDAKDYDGSNPFAVLTNQLITPHYNMHTNLDYEQLEYFENFFEGFYEYFDREILKIKQPRKLEVFLFSNLNYYRPFAIRLRGPNFTPYGFYSPSRNIIVVNADTGLGTTAHELAHHFVSCGFDQSPSHWIHEGIATFFEKFIGHLDENGKLHLTVGYFSNERLPYTKEHIDEYSLPALIARRGFSQGMIRSFMMFLHKKGKFKEYVELLSNSKDDQYGLGSLEKVYDKPIDEIEKEWKQWVRDLPMDNDTFLVENEFVKTPQQWQKWWSENQHRLYFCPEEQIYRVKEAYKKPYHPPKEK